MKAAYRIKIPTPDKSEVEVEADTAEEVVQVFRAVSEVERQRYAEVMSLRNEVECLRTLTDVLRRALAKYEGKSPTPTPAPGAGEQEEGT